MSEEIKKNGDSKETKELDVLDHLKRVEAKVKQAVVVKMVGEIKRMASQVLELKEKCTAVLTEVGLSAEDVKRVIDFVNNLPSVQLNDGDKVIFLPFPGGLNVFLEAYFYIWIGDSFRKMFLLSDKSIFLPLINDLIKNVTIFKSHYGRRYYSLVCVNDTLSHIHYGTIILTKFRKNTHFLIDNPKCVTSLNIIKKMTKSIDKKL